jgi:mRNA-degrading endonuclease YafQ of YafQ-DinJ toxin-antitoxin module
MHEDKEDDEIAKRKKGQKGKNQKKEEKKKVLNSVVKNYAPIPASSRRHLISVLWAGLQKSE